MDYARLYYRFLIIGWIIILILTNICTFHFTKDWYGAAYGQCLEDKAEIPACCARSKECAVLRYRSFKGLR